MQGPYITRHVTNALIARSGEMGQHMTHLRVHKLLYMLQGFALCIYGKPVLAERFAVWPLGPVLESIFGPLSAQSSKSGRLAMIEEPGLRIYSSSALFAGVPKTDQDFWALLDQVLESFQDWSDVKLGGFANGSSSPWHAITQGQAYTQAACLLDDQAIAAHIRPALQAQGLAETKPKLELV